MELKFGLFFLIMGVFKGSLAQLETDPNDCGLDLRSNYASDCGQPEPEVPVSPNPGIPDEHIHDVFGTPRTDTVSNEPYINVNPGTPPPTTFNSIRQKGRYHGCFKDKLNRMFKRSTILGLKATIEKCVDFCAHEGYVYAGLQAKKFCFCGSIFPSDAGYPQIEENKCGMSCWGNRNQMCGGLFTASVYETGNEVISG